MPLNVDSALVEEYASLVADVRIRELAFWSAVNLVANAVSKCEFRTYLNGKEVKKEEYYTWNISPNKNQNSSAFIHKWISTLFRDNEALVIDLDGQLLVADSYKRKPYALLDDSFTEVRVGDFQFNRLFTQSEVLYVQLNAVNIRKVVNGLYDSYSKLISYSMNSFQKSRGTKGVFKYDTLPIAGTPERDAFDKLINEKISKWLTSDNAALPLGRGQEWKENEKKTYSSENTRDIRALINDIYDFTANGFGIPPPLLKGDVQDTTKAVDQLLTFCIDPLVDNLQEEINRKRNGYTGFVKGTKVKIVTNSIKHVDLLSSATAIDKIIGSGSFCVNDIRRAIGEEVIDEPWAWQHYITKNYATIEDILQSLGGDPTVSNKNDGGE